MNPENNVSILWKAVVNTYPLFTHSIPSLASNALNPIPSADGKEIVVPKCDKCGYHKCQLIGNEAVMWICMSCGGQ